MASFTTQKLIAEAREIILETTDEIVDDDTLLLYANLTKDDIAMRVPAKEFRQVFTVNFVGGLGAIPTNFVSVYKVRDTAVVGTGNDFDNYERDEFLGANFDYGLSQINGQFAVYPTSTPVLYIDAFISVPDMTDGDGDLPTGVPSYLQELIIPGIVYRALRKLQEDNRANFYQGLYESELSKKSSAISNIQEQGQQDGALFTPIRIL